MSGKGGYMRPRKPAPVSGPGKFSRRTDGGPSVDNPTQAARYISGQPYGEGQVLNGLAGAAPLAAAPDTPSPAHVVPLSAPTARPGEPVTHGAPLGAGAGPESWQGLFPPPVSSEPDAVAAAVRAAYTKYPSPYLRAMVEALQSEGR